MAEGDHLMPESACVACTILFSAIGISYGVYIYFKNNLGGTVDEEIDMYLNENYNSQRNQQSQNQSSIKGPAYSDQNIKLYYKGISEQIRSSSIDLFKNQTLLMVFFALLFALCFLIWLASVDRSYLLLIAFTLGCCCTAVNTLITLEASIAAVVKAAVLTQSTHQLKFTYQNSAAICIATTSISLLTLSILLPSFISVLNDDEQNVEGYSAILGSVFGFALGTAFASLFYREAGGSTAKGLLVGKDLIVKSTYQSYEQTVLDVNLNTVSIISNIYNSNVVSVIDFQTIFSAFLCSYLLALSQSDTIVKEAHCLFYLPLFVVGLNLIIAIVSAFIINPLEYDDKTNIPEDTSKQVRLQILISNAGALLVLLITPIFLVPSGFSIGSTKKGEENAVSHEGITVPDAIYAFIAGLAAQTLLIVYSEVSTSTYYSQVKNIATVTQKNIKGGFSLTLLTANEQANISQIGIFFLFGILIMLGYLLSGLFGIACCILGFISAPFCMMSVNTLAGIVAQAFEIAGISYLKVSRQKLFPLNWVSHNFSIYSQIITVIGMILTNILCIGVCVFISQNYNAYAWDGYGIIGFIYGGSLAYFLKGTGLYSIKSVAENLCLLSIAFLGYFFGTETLISFVLGANLVGIFLCFNSLIIGYSVKNAREYNRNYGKVGDVDEAAVQADITTTASEGIPGTALITYLIFITLFVLQGAAKWGELGVFRKYIESGDFKKLADSSTDGYLEDVKGAFDGENGTEQ